MYTCTCSIWLYKQEILQVMGKTACEGMGDRQRYDEERV